MLRGAILLAFAGLRSGVVFAETGACVALRTPTAAGEFLTKDTIVEVPCRSENPRLPITYDTKTKAPLTVDALAAGTYLGHLLIESGKIAAAGEKLQLVIRSGPVTITREVSSLQSVRAGNRALVRTEDGQVLSARFVAAEEMQ